MPPVKEVRDASDDDDDDEDDDIVFVGSSKVAKDDDDDDDAGSRSRRRESMTPTSPPRTPSPKRRGKIEGKTPKRKTSKEEEVDSPDGNKPHDVLLIDTNQGTRDKHIQK